MKKTSCCKTIFKGLITLALLGVGLMTNTVQAATLSVPKPSVSKGTYTAYVRVTWSKVAKSKGYVIRRGTSATYSKSSVVKKISSAGTTSFNDTSATPGRTYYYWICPRKSSSKYVYSAEKYASGSRKKSASGNSSSGSSASSTSLATRLYYLALYQNYLALAEKQRQEYMRLEAQYDWNVQNHIGVVSTARNIQIARALCNSYTKLAYECYAKALGC